VKRGLASLQRNLHRSDSWEGNHPLARIPLTATARTDWYHLLLPVLPHLKSPAGRTHASLYALIRREESASCIISRNTTHASGCARTNVPYTAPHKPPRSCGGDYHRRLYLRVNIGVTCICTLAVNRSRDTTISFRGMATAAAGIISARCALFSSRADKPARLLLPRDALRELRPLPFLCGTPRCGPHRGLAIIWRAAWHLSRRTSVAAPASICAGVSLRCRYGTPLRGAA